MLRVGVLVLAGLCVLAGLIALVTGAFPPALIFGAWGILLVIGTVYERIRYKPVLQQPPGAGWQRTPERFVDPQSGQPVTVYSDPVSGERRYVQE